MKGSLSVQHLSIIKKRDGWETPLELFTQACVDYHIRPTLDVCATNLSKKCDQYIGPDHKNSARRDALHMAWDSDFFMNPPYSRITEFMDYAFAQVWEYRLNALFLTYSKTDTKWWHKYIEGNSLVKIHFIPGRIQFLLNGVIPRTCQKCKTFYDYEIKHCTQCDNNIFLKYSSPYPSVWLVVKIPKRSKK